MGRITNDFTLEEMCFSCTARSRKIDNTPSECETRNIELLVRTILQPVRDEFGEPVIVSSGFRCKRLNKIVGGCATSQHMTGEAADIHTKSDLLEDNNRLFKLMLDMVKTGKIKVGQLIFEYGCRSKGPDWIHVSLPRSNGKQNGQILYLGCK